MTSYCTSLLLYRWVWIGTVVTVQNLTGGMFILGMVSNIFVADNSLPQDRIIRLGAIQFCYFIRYGDLLATTIMSTVLL
jgi:hypothetical protein